MAIWREYFETSYIGCLHYLVNRKLNWTERMFWLIAIVTSVGGTYYVISRTLSEYRNQKAMYKVDTNYLLWRTPFPSVVICEKKYSGMPSNLTNVVKKLLESYGYNDSMIDDDLKAKLADFAFLRPNDISPLKDYCAKNPCPSGNYSNIMYKLRNKCSDLFSYCMYNGKVFDCCEEFLPVSTAFGICFGINNYEGKADGDNSVKKLKWNIIRKPGMTQGTLYLEFKYKLLIINVVRPEEVPHVKNEKTIFKETQTTALTEGFQYYYRVNVLETVTLDDQRDVPMESRGCRFRYENNLKYFKFYSESNCILECYMRAQMKLCNCVLHTYPNVVGVPPCNLDRIFCTSGVNNLICNCDADCNSTNIQEVGSTAKFASGSFKRRNTKISFKMDVPAPTLRYIRYSLKSPLSLIVSLGGAFGFFLGCSFLSIAQVFYYFCIRFLSDYLTMRRGKKIRVKEKTLQENFRIARMKLKIQKVEEDIQRGMQEKVKESISG